MTTLSLPCAFAARCRFFAGLIIFGALLAAPTAQAQSTTTGSGDTGSSTGSGTTGSGDTGSTTGSSTGSGTSGDTGSGTGTTTSYDGGTTTDLGGGTVTLVTAIFNGGSVINGQLSADTYDGRGGSVGANLTGAGALTKTTADTLVLSGANTYAGGTTLSEGTLQIGDGGATGSIAGDITNSATLAFNRGDDYTFTGVVSGTGGLVNNGFIVRLAHAQTYTGPTSVNAGYLVLSTDVDQGLAAATTVYVATGANFDFSNRSLEIAGLTGAGQIYSYGGNTGHLTLNTAASQTYAFSGSLGGAYNAFALTKSGNGTQILSGANTYSGTTSVNAGTLRVDGSLGSGDVTVASGATLGGAGSINGFTTVQSGGHLAPGNPTGTLTFTQGLTLNTGAVLDFHLGTISNLINVTGGTLTGPASGLVTINLSDAGGFAPATYVLINYAAASGTGQFGADSFVLGTTIPGYTYNLALNGSALELTATAIPEPATTAALAGGAILLAVIVRRRRLLRS